MQLQLTKITNHKINSQWDRQLTGLTAHKTDTRVFDICLFSPMCIFLISLRLTMFANLIENSMYQQYHSRIHSSFITEYSLDLSDWRPTRPANYQAEFFFLIFYFLYSCFVSLVGYQSTRMTQGCSLNPSHPLLSHIHLPLLLTKRWFYFFNSEFTACDLADGISNVSCYYFSENNSSFFISKSSCESMGMHLVYIGSRREQIFLKENIPHRFHWIGLNGHDFLVKNCI